MEQVIPGEALRLAQEVYFANYRLGTTSGNVLGQYKIQRCSDAFFWNGTTFAAPEAWASTVDGDNHHYYDWTTPSTENEAYKVYLRPSSDDGALDERILFASTLATQADVNALFAKLFPFL